MAAGHNDEKPFRSSLASKTITPLPTTSGKDPSLPSSGPTTSKEAGDVSKEPPPSESPVKGFVDWVYDNKTGAFCGRTCKSWAAIIAYSIMYVIFLCAFTLVFLYTTLEILKNSIDFKNIDKSELLTYSEHGVGLTATPTSETDYPLIWYKNGAKEDFDKYVQALDKLFATNRRKREVSNLGPCGQSPYGYGERPCVIIRINKQLNWAGQPLRLNSTVAKSAPAEVQEWMKADKTKLWLHCSGYHSYDKEHIGRIKYYPHPPGFKADVFPIKMEMKTPLVAIQLSGFTVGISLAIQCNLWYETGPSTFEFVLYVGPDDRTVYRV